MHKKESKEEEKTNEKEIFLVVCLSAVELSALSMQRSRT